MSISSASEITKEITKEQVDRAYKKKATCSQRITTIFQNWNKEKELAQNDLEREGIDDFYEGYHAKYAAKLLSWQDVIDMYHDQELQKIQEEKEMKEKAYYDQNSRERKKSTVEPTLSRPTESEQTRLKGAVITDSLGSSVPCIHTETRMVSSTGTVSMPTTHRNQYGASTTTSLTRQRELSQEDALQTAAAFRRTIGLEVSRSSEGPVARPSVAPTSVVSPGQGGSMEEEEGEDRSIPIGSVQPTQSSLILVGHPDVRYQDIFPPEMSFSHQEEALHLDPEESWCLLYPFTEAGMRRIEMGTPANLVRLARNDALVETIQIHAYLEDIPEWGRHDFRRYPARFGDPNYVYQPRVNGVTRERSE